MTIETEIGGEPVTKSGPYAGNGVTAVFDYDFQIQADDEVRVVRQNADLTETVLTLTTDYTVAGVGNDDGGQITLVDPATDAPSGTQLILQYDGDYNQSVDYSNQGAIQLGLLEDGLDKITMHLRGLKERVDRAVTTDSFGTVDLETLTANINKLVAIESEIVAVADNISDVITVSGDSADIQVVASISDDIQALTNDFSGGNLRGLWIFTTEQWLGIPSGTTAERGPDPGPSIAGFRYNQTTTDFEGWDGTAWGSIGGAGQFRGENGLSGNSFGGGDIFRVHEQELNTDVTIAATENSVAVGPLSIASGVTLTVSTGGNLVVV